MTYDVHDISTQHGHFELNRHSVEDSCCLFALYDMPCYQVVSFPVVCGKHWLLGVLSYGANRLCNYQDSCRMSRMS